VIVAIDPSMHCSGVAVFKEDHKLVDYFNVHVPTTKSGGDAIIMMTKKVFVETPSDISALVVEVQNPRGANERMSKQDLMNLHAVCYSILCKVAEPKTICRPVYPFDWNRGVPKKIMHNRMADKYGISRMPGPEDYLDAVGIGDYYIRSKRGKCVG